MSYHPNLPTLALSSRLSKLLSLPALSAIVEGAALDGVDVDLTRHTWLLRPRDLVLPDSATAPICSLWLPRRLSVATTKQEADDLLSLCDAPSTYGLPLLIVDRPEPTGDQLPAQASAQLVDSVRRRLGSTDRAIAMALRASDLRGTREHLQQLTALRRAAEEWDFLIALDLLGGIDTRWEAEAAVTRLMPRLGLIRLSACSMSRGAGTRAYMTGRTIAAAFDAGFTGTIAIAPRMPFWRRAHPATALPAVNDLGQSLRDRFTRIAQPESLPRPTQPHPYL